MKLLACFSVLAVALAALVLTLFVRRRVEKMAERWRWVERVGDWLWERRERR